MLYERTQLNILSLFRTVGYARPDQLIRFFSDAPDAKSVEFYIKQLLSSQYLVLGNQGNILKYRKAPNITHSAIVNRLNALWVLASFDSSEVRQVYLMPYPTELAFITNDNLAYDVTCCDSTTVAQMAMTKREQSLPAGVTDDINHIVIVPNAQIGESLSPYGFDSYCIFDSNKMPHYHTW